MRHGAIVGIAAIAVALVMGALFADWESGSAPGSTANIALQEGRAATATDPANPASEHVFPISLLD